MSLERPSRSLSADAAIFPPATPPSAARSPSGAVPGAERWGIEFRGNGLDLLAIGIVNALLNLVTLGIWFAWGRVRELRFVIANTWVAGDPLSFHGRGGELFRGVLLAFLVFILPLYGLVFYASRAEAGEGVLALLLVYAGVFLLVAFASVSSLRYRLPRTEWRGIRFGFDGTAWDFLGGYLGRALLVGVTLGFYYPSYACWRRRWILERCRLGTEHFACDAEPDPLYGPFVACWFLSLVTFGFSWLWYIGHQQAYLWNRSRLGGSRFSCGMTGWGWVGLHLENLVLALFTLGLAAPWILVRTHRYFLTHLSLDGTLDLAAIRQRLQRTSSVGEGTLEALDMDSGLDLG